MNIKEQHLNHLFQREREKDSTKKCVPFKLLIQFKMMTRKTMLANGECFESILICNDKHDL